MLNLILYWIDFIFMVIVLINCLISDFKTRKISNQLFKVYFIFAIILVFMESLLFLKEIYLYICIKCVYMFLAMVLSCILFSLKIIGGGDGKVIILTFFIWPIKDLNYFYLFNFFMFLLLFYFLLIMINLCLNSFTANRASFIFYFHTVDNLTIFQKFYFLSFFKFINLSSFYKYKEKKLFLKSLNIIFNPKSFTFQVFVQYKPLVIASCFFSYLLLSLTRLLI